MKRASRLFQYVHYRMRVTLSDGRTFVGSFMAYDTHMNLVLGDAEEFRKVKVKGGEEKEEKRMLGLIILRGDSVVSLTVEGPPPKEESRAKTVQKEAQAAAPGVARAAARGMSIPMGAQQAPQPGLAGPMPGVGAPNAASMTPGMPGMPPPPPGMPFPPPPPGFPGMPPFGRGMPFPPPPPGSRNMPPFMPPPPPNTNQQPPNPPQQ